MTFAGPGKRDDELDAGIAAGATISVESEGEARRAILAGERLGIRPKLAVRVNPPFAIENGKITHGRSAEPVRSRCGARARTGPGPASRPVSTGAACTFSPPPSASTTAADRGAPRDHHLRRGDRQALDMPLPELNLGGGFDVPCFDGEQALDVYRLADGAARDLVRRARTAGDDPPLARARPLARRRMRGLSDPRSSTAPKAAARPSSPPTAAATICCAPPAACWSAAAAITRSPSPTASTRPREEQVTVTGCLATPHDVLGDEVMLPRAEPGDLIAIFAAGAYGLRASPQAWESRPPAREMLV